VPADGATEVTSGGWLPQTEVTVRFGNPIGDPIEVITDANGEFTVTVPVPDEAVVGETYELDATDANGAMASTPVEVVAAQTGDDPSIIVEPDEVEPGGSVDVIGENFPPSTDVIVEISDEDGPVCPPLEVTTDDAGAFQVTLELCEDAGPGDYTVSANPADGSPGASADLTVTAPAGDGDGDGSGDGDGGQGSGDGTGSGPGNLPGTGSDTALLVLLAMSALAAGGVLIRTTRLRGDRG